MKTKKTKNKPWFRSVRSSYLPISWQGLVVYLLYVAYIIAVPVVWYRDGHYLWPLLIKVIPALVLALLITQLVASKHSK